jgi:hypothetical protein
MREYRENNCAVVLKNHPKQKQRPQHKRYSGAIDDAFCAMQQIFLTPEQFSMGALTVR